MSVHDPSFEMLRATVHTALTKWRHYPWSRQGFGMLRTYFGEGERFRLNVWHTALRVKGVSTIHNHPWDFTSIVVAGALVNQPYFERREFDAPSCRRGKLYDWMLLRTGPDGGPYSHGEEPRELVLGASTAYLPGQWYSQEADRIHETFYLDGTVTVNDRTRHDGSELAHVYWPHGQQWVDAKPSPASDGEIEPVVAAALALRWQ